jgi:organic hydroperoxide reductase OsmC/OhrA
MELLQPVQLELQSGYVFDVDFGLPNVSPLKTDATPPLGTGGGPDSEMLLMAAVANCLAASLAFALRKYKNEDVPMRAKVHGQVVRNEAGRLRMHSMMVDIRLGVPVSTLRLAQRALQQYEDFCVVTQSVRAAIPVEVQVFDSDGLLISE